MYAKNNTIDESDKDILIALIKYFLYDMQHKIKYNYINMLIIENQEQPIIEDKAKTLQSFLFYAQRIAGIRYQKIVVNEAVLLNDDTIMEIEKEASVDSILSKDSSQTLTEKEGLSNKAVQPLANEKKNSSTILDKEKLLEKLCLLYIIGNKSERYLKKLMKGLKYPMVNVLNWILLRFVLY